MAVFAFTDGTAVINSVNLSDHIRKITLTTSAAQLDTTAMGTGGYMSRIGGLKDWSIALDFNQDFAAANVDATLFPLLGTNTTFTVKATSAAGSATNPTYSGSVLIADYKPLDGQVGNLAMTSITWPGAGTLSRFTT